MLKGKINNNNPLNFDPITPLIMVSQIPILRMKQGEVCTLMMGTHLTIKVDHISFAISSFPTASFPAGVCVCVGPYCCVYVCINRHPVFPGVGTKVGCLLPSHGWRELW